MESITTESNMPQNERIEGEGKKKSGQSSGENLVKDRTWEEG